MAFSVGGAKGRPSGEINVTPLIDIVLVLLIIFMVMTPVMLKELVAKVPQKSTELVPQPPGENPIIVELDARDALTLNRATQKPNFTRRTFAGTMLARRGMATRQIRLPPVKELRMKRLFPRAMPEALALLGLVACAGMSCSAPKSGVKPGAPVLLKLTI